MLSVRSGWPKAEILALTPSEAALLLGEMTALEDQREARMAEALHNPAALAERTKKAQGGTIDGWVALARKFAPEKANGLEQILAAQKFLEEKRRRGGA